MRIIAGSAKGRLLLAPEGTSTRPTSNRVREAVFNSLFSLGGIDGLEVVDLFAGSGAYGLEALSRGARHATFVERDRSALEALRENIDALGFESDSTVIAGDAQRWIERQPLGELVDLVFCDPPYDFDAWAELVGSLRAERCVAESRREIEVPQPWGVLRSRRYASTVVTLLERVDVDNKDSNSGSSSSGSSSSGSSSSLFPSVGESASLANSPSNQQGSSR